MNEDKKLFKEDELELVSGGRRPASAPNRGKGKNDVCPRCGKSVYGYGAYDIDGMGVQLVYMCDDCEIAWLRKTASSEAKTYEMVSYNWDGNGKKYYLGPYHG